MNILNYWKNLYNWKNPLNWCDCLDIGVALLSGHGSAQQKDIVIEILGVQIFFILSFFIDSITSFKKNLLGAPSDLYDEKNDSIKKWEEYLDEMVKHFYNSLEENEVQKNEYEQEYHRLNPLEIEDRDGVYYMKEATSPEAKEAREKWYKREQEIIQWRKSELNKGFKMLKERFWDLWD